MRRASSGRSTLSLALVATLVALLGLLLPTSAGLSPAVVRAAPEGAAPSASYSPSRSSGLPLPDPLSYSALGDSITPAYDSDGNILHLGPQPWYSYAVGNVSSVDSFYQRLLRIYPNGTDGGTLQPHLLAVPGDKASDMVWQSLEAVANHSGFVTILIGGNDVCDSSSGTPTPTPVWNFSTSLNRSFHILRSNLPADTVIALANVVNVTTLWTLFGGDSQAQLVWQSTCPALLTAPGRALMEYMIRAYNHMEELIARAYGVSLWDLGNMTFSVGDVNHLDFFHPSPSGQLRISDTWWATLPYATMFPHFTSAPALPASVPVATALAVKVGIEDPTAVSATVTYQETGAFFWATVPLAFQSGSPYNGTYGATLPFNATAVAGTLELYVVATDTPGYLATSPAGAPETLDQVAIVPPGNATPSPLSSVRLSPSTPPTLDPGGTLTMSATPIAQNGSEELAGVSYAWSVSPASLGQLIPEGEGASALFVAGEGAAGGSIFVNASSGVLVASASAAVAVGSSPSASGLPPPPAGPSPLGRSSALPDLGLLIVVAPAGFLLSTAIIGLLLRRKYLRAGSKGVPPKGPAAAGPGPSGGPDANDDAV